MVTFAFMVGWFLEGPLMCMNSRGMIFLRGHLCVYSRMSFFEPAVLCRIIFFSQGPGSTALNATVTL